MHAASPETQIPATIEQFQKIQADLHSARASSNALSYLEASKRMYALLNGSPDAVLQLASAQCGAGSTGDALVTYRQFVRMGLSRDELIESNRFTPLRSMPEYPELRAQAAENLKAISRAQQVLQFPEPSLVPEDVDYDPRTKLFYVTSVLRGTISTLTLDGHLHTFAAAPDGWPMFAIKVDASHGLLWATEVAVDGFTRVPEKDWDRSAVLVYDLRSGALLHRVEGPPHSALGDLCLTPEGDALVSDGENGGSYRVSREKGALDPLNLTDFISPQTPAMLSDGLRAAVPDYVRGIGILTLATGKVDWLPGEGAHALSGIDGLYVRGHTLLATQNGTTPVRVIRFNMDVSFSHVVSESVIERTTPSLGVPTHGVIVGHQFYYIANSGWDVLDEHGNPHPGATLPVSVLMRSDVADASR